MALSSSMIAMDTPLLETAEEGDVPELDPDILAARYDGTNFEYPDYEDIHDADYEYFRNLSQKAVFCDIGANIGQSVVTLRQLGCRAQLHSFEVNPLCWPNLTKRGRDYRGSFTLHAHGLNDIAGDRMMFIPVNGNSAASTLAAMDLKALQTPHLLGVLKSLEPLEPWRVVKIKCSFKVFDTLSIDPDFVKIDVEGAELNVLKGMTETIRRKTPVLLIENTNTRAIDDFLAPMGYLPFRWNDELSCVELIKRSHRGSGIFGLRNRSRDIKIGHGNTGNTLYLHASEIASIIRNEAMQNLRINGFEARVNPTRQMSLNLPSDAEYVNTLFNVLFGVNASEEQIRIHTHNSVDRKTVRDRFLRFLNK